MKVLLFLLFMYFLLGIGLCLSNIPDVDQLGNVLLKVPIYTLLPFSFLLLMVVRDASYKQKIIFYRDVLFLAFCFSVTTSFWVFYLNMNIGEHRTVNISGTIVSKKPGRGKSKPCIVIRKESGDISLSVIREMWKNIEIGDKYSITLHEGMFGFYYLNKFEQ